MAEYENSEDLTSACEGEISDILQADLNLRATDWTNSSTELVPEETNEVQEEICESVVEEIVGDQENNYLECMEDSILYVFEEQIVEYELSDFLQAPETFEMEEAEAPEPDAMNFYSSQEDNIVCEENEEPGTSKVEASDDSVNNCGENELVLNKCTVDLPISSDNSLKTCNFNENSDSVDNNLLVSELIEEDENNSELEEEENVIYGPMPRDIADPSTPENMTEPSTPEINPKIDESIFESSPSVIKTPNLLPSMFKNQSSPLKKISSEMNSPTETISPQSDNSSPALRTLGKEQIKKRLQSFSLLKQGITAIPIKKIISPKAPKVHMQMGEVYDETGRKTDKEIIIKKPPKQGPTPSEKAKQVIDEIEQIKREEAAIYEQTLSYMKYSMRDAHRQKSRLRGRGRNRSKSPIRKDKKYDKDIPKRPRKNSEDDKFRTENDKHRKSPETDRHRKISEHDKFEKKRRDKSPEKPKEEEMPNTWTEIKQKNLDFEKISKIKSKLFKYPERKSSPARFANKGKNKKSNVNIEEVNTNFKKEDYIKPQLMFEGPSLLRTPLSVLGINGKSKNFPTELIRFTEKSVPHISFCENPNNSSNLFRSRKQVLSEIPEERAEIMMKIIENKNEPLKLGKYISGVWYDPLNYLTESKNEVEIEAVKSYGLSVLSEMYNEQDEPEETHEEEIEKSEKDSKEKKKKERKKSKKKHKKRKTKSKSRSSSKDRSQEDEEDKNEKSKKSKKKKHKDIDNSEKTQEVDSTKFEIESQTELEANMTSMREEKIPNDDGTPNTDEYRSNWESDEDIMNEIIRTDEPATYNKSFRRSLDQDWAIEESIPDVYDNRRQFNDSERRQSHRSSEHLRQEEMYEHSMEFIPEIEDRRSSINLRVSEERYSRHSYEKPESRRNCDEFEYRHSSINLKNSGGRLASRFEEIAAYDCRSSNPRRSEDKPSSRHSYDRSDSRKSYDHRQESEEKTDYEPRRTSLRRSEEKERVKHHSESVNKKSRELRHELIEKPNNPYRKTSETDSKRSRESVEKLSEDRSYESLKKYDDRYRQPSVEKSYDLYRKTSESDSKRSKESVEKIQKISEDRSHESLEKYEERYRRTSLEKSDNRYTKTSESDRKRSRESVENIQKISEDRNHEPLEKYDDRCRKTSLEKSDGRYRKTSESSKLEDEKRSQHSSEREKKIEPRRKSRFEPIEITEDRNWEEKYETKKQIEDKVRESSERDNKRQRDKRHESLDKSRDQKFESEEKSYNFSKQEINEKPAKESREKKISCSSDDRKRDSKLERSRTPDRKKAEHAKYEEKKDKNIVHNKWSSDEDIQRSYRRYSRNIEQSPIQLNLNYKHQKSQWSSDEDLHRKKSISDSRRSRNFEDNFQLQKSRPKSIISENDSGSYRSRYENLLDDDLVNLKDLERNRKLAEEKVKSNRSKEKEDYRKNSKKKSKAEKKKHEEREKYKKNKKKIRDKKQKSKSKDKKTKVKIIYSDLEDSYDEDFKTAKQKEQDLFIKSKSENVKKHAAKIKIDYSDFDISLVESKDKYDKKFEEGPTSNIPKVESAPHTPKERKVNIDLSEIIIDHQVTTSKNLDVETPKSQTSVLSSINTPESFITISEVSESPKTISDTSETSKSTVKLTESSKLIPITSEKPKPIPDALEPSKPTQKTVEKSTKSVPKTPEIQKSSEVTKDKLVTPICAKISEEHDQKTPKKELIIEGITPITPKNKPSSIMVTPASTPIKMLPEITPVAPPTPIPKPIIEPVTPVTPDPSKLVSEYEEFMKAVSFDEPKDDVVDKRVKKLQDVKEITLKQKKDVEDKKPTEIVADSAKDKSTEESDSSLEESSSEYESSESEHSDSSSESESLSPDSAKHRMLETVAKIKKEKLTDSESESQESRKRKDRDFSPENETFKSIAVKTEKDSKKMKKSEELKPFECSSKYDNIIDWEKTCIDNINYTTGAINLPTVTEMLPPLPENIPLPSDEIVPQIPVEDIPTPEDYLHTPSHMQSPVDCIYISSDNTTPSPTKKPRAVIPIKFLTAESRKQANETAKLVSSDHSPGFGKFAPTQEEKVFSVDSSSDVSRSESLTTEEQEQNASRKRQSQWALSITPAKKPLLQTNPLAEEDSDEDFTDKFVKQTEKKIEKKTDEVKDKLEATVKEPPKSEVPSKDDKKSSESRKPKEDDDRSRRTHEKCDKPRENRRSSTPKLSEKDKRPRRNSRERPPSDKTDRNDPKVKPRDSLDRKRDHSPDRSRNRNTRENIRDRLRRLSERRASIPDRKAPFSRGRSPRSRYSRDRELQRSRLRDRSKDRVNKIKTPERDRSRERIRERSRDSKDRRDRSNYRKDERKYSRSPTPHRKEYRELDNIPVPQQRPDDTDFSTTSMDIAQSPVNSPLDGFKRSLADSTISDSELVAQHNTPDESNEPSPRYNPQQFYPQVKEIPPERHTSPQSPKRISLDDRISLLVNLEKEPPKHIDTVCTRGPYTNNTNYDAYSFRSEYDLYNSQPQPEGFPPYSNQYQQQQQYYPNQINTDNNIKVVQVGNVIQVVPTEQPPPPPIPSTSSVPKPNEGPPKVLQVGNVLQIVPMTIIETAAVSSPLTTVAPTVVEKPVAPKPTDQLVLERRAEKEKRRQEREQRRKEKEKKRKEKEKRRQMKIKTKTENMIKRALMLETGEGELDISNIDTEPASETNDNNNQSLSWPPASSLTPLTLPKPPSKGILVTHGFREKDESLLDDSVETRKVVKFADGICPGEGTSPSGGEELPSPPPPPRKLPKEKRYKKVKNKNKKKIKDELTTSKRHSRVHIPRSAKAECHTYSGHPQILVDVDFHRIKKVKIIRTQQQNPDDDSSSEDNLPPPPPPPGSPPPHLWPPRVKAPPVNNIHPALPSSVFPHGPPPPYPVPGPGPQQMMYPPVYPPISAAGPPVVMTHAPPPPRQHHPPVMPVGPPPPPLHHGAHQSSFHH